MDIYEFFDVKSSEHIDAFRHLELTGTWPIGFIPEHVTISLQGCWQASLYAKLAHAYLDQVK